MSLTVWQITPADDKRDFYSAGYDGNWFATEADALAAIPSLRALGGEFDHEWVAVEVPAPEPGTADARLAAACGVSTCSVTA